jgi:tetratricopeptide (TPR) repeat protein
MQKGKWDEAEKLTRQALEETPEDGKTRRQLAETTWRRGAANEAMSHMAAAVRLEPANAEFLVRAGEMALASGAKEAALSHADQAIRIEPRRASAWALRGRTFRQLNQRERARTDLQRALVIAPNSPELLWELAVLYRENGQPVRCLTTLHHLHDTYPPGEEPQTALLLEGLTLIELKRPHQAAEVLVAASARGPADANLLYTLAQAQSAAGRVAEATSAVQQALAVDGSHQPSKQLLAQLASQSSTPEVQRR